MSNYVDINGKKIELKDNVTENELIELGIVKSNPFDIKYGETGYFICGNFEISDWSHWCIEDKNKYCPCKDKELVKKRANKEYLSRLLWKFKNENDDTLTEEELFDGSIKKWYIGYDFSEHNYKADFIYRWGLITEQCFKTKEVCERAINEVLIPFINGKFN